MKVASTNVPGNSLLLAPFRIITGDAACRLATVASTKIIVIDKTWLLNHFSLFPSVKLEHARPRVFTGSQQNSASAHGAFPNNRPRKQAGH
jgi:hypothetical protein